MQERGEGKGKWVGRGGRVEGWGEFIFLKILFFLKNNIEVIPSEVTSQLIGITAVFEILISSQTDN